MLVSFFAVFALRGIYFALLQEIKTPKHLTGSTVGLVSLVGYTPDIFFAPITGESLTTRQAWPAINIISCSWLGLR